MFRKSSSQSMFAQALNLLSQLCLVASSCALVLLVVIFGWLVFGRYVLNVTPTWVEQLSLLLVGYIAFVGSATGVHENTHLGVTLFREMLPGPLREIAEVVADVIMAGFGVVMALACLELMQFGWSTKLPMLNIPESFRTLPALLCGAFTFLFAGSRALVQAGRLLQTKRPTDKQGL